MNDEQLVEQFQNGETKAFDELVRRYQNHVLNTCFRYLNNKDEAQDAAQEIFVKLYHALPKFKPRAKFSTWLYRIVVNHSLNMKRSKKRRDWIQSMGGLKKDDVAQVNLVQAPGSETPEARLQAQERLEIVQHALNKLNHAQRTAVILHRFEELSYKEIASVMGASVSSVESLIFRAKKNLYKILKSHF